MSEYSFSSVGFHVNRISAIFFCMASIVVYSLSGLAPYVGLDFDAVRDMAVSSGAPWYRHLNYQAAHANVFHLVANVSSMTAICFGFFRLPKLAVPMAYAISAVVPVGVPTVGLSGVIFALLGMISHFSSKRLVYHAWMTAFVVLTALPGYSNWQLHVATYVAGMAYAWFVSPPNSKP